MDKDIRNILANSNDHFAMHLHVLQVHSDKLARYHKSQQDSIYLEGIQLLASGSRDSTISAGHFHTGNVPQHLPDI